MITINHDTRRNMSLKNAWHQQECVRVRMDNCPIGKSFHIVYSEFRAMIMISVRILVDGSFAYVARLVVDSQPAHKSKQKVKSVFSFPMAAKIKIISVEKICYSFSAEIPKRILNGLKALIVMREQWTFYLTNIMLLITSLFVILHSSARVRARKHTSDTLMRTKEKMLQKLPLANRVISN